MSLTSPATEELRSSYFGNLDGSWIVEGSRNIGPCMVDVVTYDHGPGYEQTCSVEINHHHQYGFPAKFVADEIRLLTTNFALVPWSPLDSGPVGCFIDGHWGQYAIARVVEIARDLGWDDAEGIDIATRHLASAGPFAALDISDEEHGVLVDAADDAERWLNDHVAPKGFSFGWYDGEFFLWSDESWEEMD